MKYILQHSSDNSNGPRWSKQNKELMVSQQAVLLYLILGASSIIRIKMHLYNNQRRRKEKR
jgi:hypothetical protein